MRAQQRQSKIDNQEGVAAHRVGTPSEVADLLENDINLGRLAPGAWLKQIDLERRYGCSRIDVRQALEQLVTKRLVRHIPNRGYHVDVFDDRQVREIAEVRVVLETAAADDIVDNARADVLARLRCHAECFSDAVRDATIAEQNDANMAYHREMLALCANQELVELILELRKRVPIAVQRIWNTQSRLEKTAREHFHMIDALADHDRNLFKRILTNHISYTNLP